MVLDASTAAPRVLCIYPWDGNSMAKHCNGNFGDGHSCIPGELAFAPHAVLTQVLLSWSHTTLPYVLSYVTTTDGSAYTFVRAHSCVLYPQVARPSGLSARATTLHGGVLTRRSVSMRRFATTPPS